MINRWNLVLYCIIGWWIAGCNSKPENTPEAILSRPPYTGITDSIRNAPQNAELYLVRGLRLSQHDQHELAGADYKKAWELQPSEGTALQYISNLLLTNKPAAAVDLLNTCMEKYPANTEFQRRLGEVYAQVGAGEKALEQYDLLLAKDSSDFEAWLEKGVLLAQLADTPAATAALERSYALQPLSYNGKTLAELYSEAGNVKVLALCDTLVVKDSSIAKEADLLKGAYYSRIKQYDKALIHYDESIRLDWTFVDPYLEKGIILYKMKQYDKAREILATAASITMKKPVPEVYYWMGRCYEASGDKENALENYQRAYSLDKSFHEARDAIKRLK
jgi:tetratricopeptide (TPR) repeat protein